MSNLCNQTLKDDVKRSAYDTSADFSGAILESLDGQYLITDVCANLTNKKFARDVDCVIQRAQNAGVKKIIVSGTNIQTSKEALRLTRLFPNYIYCAAGVHPNDAKTWDEDVEGALREILSNPECKAIGQCGLDFAKSISEPHEQRDVLKKQVQLAVELKKPILIYEKDAHSDLIQLLKSDVLCLPEIVIHSFVGKIEELQAYLSLGCYIGLNGSIWKDKSEDGLKKMLEDRLIPLDHLLVESDSPFMYPNTRASHIPTNIKEKLTEKSLSFLQRYCTFQRNEPCSLPVCVEMIAEYYKMKPEELALQTTYSALKLFGLD